jgi:hypothetical protein
VLAGVAKIILADYSLLLLLLAILIATASPKSSEEYAISFFIGGLLFFAPLHEKPKGRLLRLFRRGPQDEQSSHGMCSSFLQDCISLFFCSSFHAGYLDCIETMVFVMTEYLSLKPD